MISIIRQSLYDAGDMVGLFGVVCVVDSPY